jgi:hypothetical protein
MLQNTILFKALIYLPKHMQTKDAFCIHINCYMYKINNFLYIKLTADLDLLFELGEHVALFQVQVHF